MHECPGCGKQVDGIWSEGIWSEGNIRWPICKECTEHYHNKKKLRSKKDLIDRLEPFLQGCFSGRISEWPKLKSLLRDIYGFLKNSL